MHAFVDWLQTRTLQVHIYPPYALKQENLRDSGFSKTCTSSESVKIGLFETLEACNTNTNTNDNVYGAVIKARLLREFTRFI